MKVLRSSFVAAVAIFAAACGDKVNIVQPGPTVVTAGVSAVSVAPGTATMSVGQTVSFSAVVTATGTAATTVTWASTDAARVSVSAAGVATAVAATPGVAICATSTVNTNAKGCASVAVSAAATTVPASVSIASITGAGGLNTPVNPLAVVGQIDVSLNVNPGTQTVSKIVVVVGTVRADSQTFTAAQAASLRYVADEAAASQTDATVANQSTFPQIVFSINTAAITSTATGAVRWTNGAQQVSVQLFTSGSTTAATATAQTSLTFVNVDGWFATVTGSLQNALNAGGFRYDRGPITVAAVPVSYTGGAVASGSVNFGSLACDASTTGARTTALVAPATGTSAWTATLANTGTAGADNVNGYEFATCGLNAIGETVTVTAVNGAGDALFTAAAPINAGAVTGIRLDNRAPLAPAVNAAQAATLGIGRAVAGNSMPNGRTSSWVNDAVGFNALATTTATVSGLTSNGLICNNVLNTAEVGGCPTTAALAAAGLLSAAQALVFSVTAPGDVGVGGVTYALRSAATTSPTTAAAGASLTGAATLAASATNATYCGVAFATDAVGNASLANPMASASITCAGQQTAGNVNMVRFGVDRAAPTIAFDVTSLGANARINAATLVGNFIVTVADTGAVGNSGMAPVAAGTTSGPVLMNATRRRADGTTQRDVSAGSASLFGSTALINTGVAYAAPLGSSAMGALATTGTSGAYWSVAALAQDAAGNRSATLTRTVAGDGTVAIVTAASVPASITGSFATSALLSDNLDLRDNYFTAAYGGGLLAGVPYGLAVTTFTTTATATAINGYNATPLINTNHPVSATINVPLILQAVTGVNAPVAYAAIAANAVTGVNLFARDQTQAAYGSAATAIAFGNITAPLAGISLASFTTMVPATNAAATLCGATGLGGGCVVGTGGAVATGNLTATLTGTTGVFNNPFAGGVNFYALNAAATDWVLLGAVAASSATLVDNGATRVWTYTLTVNGATAFAALGGTGANFGGAANVIAIGMNGAGTVGMVSLPIAQTFLY